MQAEPPAAAEPAIGEHPFTRALIDAHERLAPKIAQANTEHVVNLLEAFEADMAKYVAPIAQRIRDDPSTPADVHPLLDALLAPPHFGVSLAISFALGAILSPVIGAAFAPAVQGISNAAWAANPSQPLAPSVLAAAVLKGVEDEGTAASEAAKSGVSAGAFDVMVKAAGNAIGIEQALLLYRRGLITLAQLQAVARYSNLNPQFYPMVELLRYSPPPAGEVITGALKRHLPDAEARAKLGEAGIDPANYDWLLASAGRPPGVEMTVQLWNHGLATEADVDQVIAQSDINPDFAALVKQTRIYFLPPRSVIPMLRAGAITEAQARTKLAQHGVQPDDIDAFIKEGTKASTGTVKELAAAQVVRGYELDLIPRAEAITRLETLKYNADDAALYLDIADGARDQRLIDGAVTRIRNAYLSHKITKQVAQTDLGKLNVPAAAVTQYLAVWDNELFANVQVLTISQLQGALYRDVLTLTQFITQVQQRGWSGIQVKILAAEAYPHGKVPDAVLNLNAANL